MLFKSEKIIYAQTSIRTFKVVLTLKSPILLKKKQNRLPPSVDIKLWKCSRMFRKSPSCRGYLPSACFVCHKFYDL